MPSENPKFIGLVEIRRVSFPVGISVQSTKPKFMTMKHLFRYGTLFAVAAALLSLTSCQKETFVESDGQTLSDATARKGEDNVTFYALVGGTTLDKLSARSGEQVLNSAPITGLQASEKILAIDFRPATGQLYGLGSNSRLYVINPMTGVARPITPPGSSSATYTFTTPLSGTIAGFDFNPTVDRIRVVTNTGQNLRLNPETGAVAAVDGAINGVAGAMISAVAYSNNVAGATVTVLYDIDLTTKKLYRQNPPNNGTLEEIGSLNLNIKGEGGFDIPANGYGGYGLFEVDGKPTLFSVDLRSGSTRVLAKYTKKYTAIAIPTRSVAYAVDASNRLIIFSPSSANAWERWNSDYSGSSGGSYGGDGSYNGGGYSDGGNYSGGGYGGSYDGDDYGSGSTTPKSLTGLQAGEKVLGIDFRPLNGQLYALGSTGRIYTVNTASGLVTPVGTGPISLSGTQFGFDFNPLVDRLRILSNGGQNLRFNPNDGTTITDAPLNYTATPGVTPGVTAGAYTNNFAGTTSTMLFDIDTNSDKLVLQSPPNSGVLVERGSLGVNVEANNGFDIGGASNIAYALLTSGGSTKLYTINISTGKATAISSFPSTVQGLAIGLGF